MIVVPVQLVFIAFHIFLSLYCVQEVVLVREVPLQLILAKQVLIRTVRSAQQAMSVRMKVWMHRSFVKLVSIAKQDLRLALLADQVLHVHRKVSPRLFMRQQIVKASPVVCMLSTEFTKQVPVR